MKSEPVLEVRDLHKTFYLGFFRRRVDAVRGVSFAVRKGEIFGLVGPNGAGKTTTIKMALQLIFPSQGSVSLFGKDSSDLGARGRLGYLPENPYIYSYLKPLEFLDLCGQLCNMRRQERTRRAELLIERLGLGHATERPVGKFSKGMLQRLGVCQALLHDPELLLLDEPFSGLDPIGRKDIRDLVLEQRKAGKTVIITSHVLADVEAMADRVGIVQKGALVAYGALHDLLRPEVRRVELEISGVNERLRHTLSQEAADLREVDQRLLVVVEGDQHVPRLLRAALDNGAQLHSVTPHRETLEDLFIRKALEQ